ncbi:MAG: prolipoprotein diacylglyceryl transferase [Chlamydiia bacterium]|nr:prolipoprotein diacylglyceryl transferase [Chlamydiia bacterium]
MEKYFTWDPDPTAFVLPGIHHPIAWYGILFALGFFLAFYLLRTLFIRMAGAETTWPPSALKKEGNRFAEKLTAVVIMSTVLGARLGHILFYENWGEFLSEPLRILKTWEGGLASHGGVIGIVVGLLLFMRRHKKTYPFLSVLRLIDLLVVPALFVGAFIRVGNFINQEVLGTVTTLPWAVVFLHPIDGGAPLPRHPSQLYEALFYALSALLYWKLFPRQSKNPGRLTALFFMTTFGFRFLIEWVKEEQSALLGIHGITMGQILSLPLILIGGLLLFNQHRKKGRKGEADPKES